MPYAIELYLDEESSTKIGKIHARLRQCGINVDEGASPHVSLCMDLSQEMYLKAIGMLERVELPATGRFERTGS